MTNIKTQIFKLNELNPAKYNPRKQLKPGDEEFEKLKNSIKNFGYVELIVVNIANNNTVISGHQRLSVLKYLGETEAECVVVELNEEDEKALNIAMNKVGGSWDEKLLADLLAELKDADYNLDLTGFNPEEIDSLFNNLKIFQEIITSVDIPLSNSQNKNDINEDEYEEIEDENDDMNNIMKNSDVFDDLVHKALNEILSVNNYEPLKKMINQKIMDNLSILCDIQNKLEDYYLNENDKILQMKEELGEIEYLALSIINNIIIKYQI